MKVLALIALLALAACLPYRDQIALVNSLEVGRKEDPSAWSCVGCDDSNRPISTVIVDNPKQDVKSIISVYSEYTVLAFRYTATAKNLWQDVLWAFQTQDQHAPKGCKVQKEYDNMWNSIRDNVISAIAKSTHTKRLLITGISLGGGLAVLSYVDIVKAHLFENIEVVTFGAPRVGNKQWAAWFDTLTPSLRYFIKSDPIAYLPRCLTPLCNYKQTGTAVMCEKTLDVCRANSKSNLYDAIDEIKALTEEIKEHKGDLNGIVDHIFGYKKIRDYTLEI